MPRLIPLFVPPSAGRKIVCLSALLVLLSGCAGHSLVSNDELEADRQKRQALQLRQDELLEQIIGLTSVRGELETLLATEEAKRESVERQLAIAAEQREVSERHQRELERYLQEQQAAAEGVTRLRLQLEQWREQDLERYLHGQQAAAEGVTRLGLQLEQWREQDLERQSAVTQAMFKDDAELYLQLLEGQARLSRLTDQLGEAILEVVRTKAKLRSLESRAEAASDLAEAEIAIQALMSKGEDWESDPGVIKARELSELSAREFEQGNYGGALYLTGQAKNVIRTVEARSINQAAHSMVEGEKAFSLPLPLLLLNDSDVRQGPDDRSSVVLTLPEGADLIGYSYKGQWVHVKTADGVGGWVYYRNLGSPD
jgi:hypothetical protein